VSQIYTTLNNNNGAPPLDRIYAQNKSSPNFVSVLLGRSTDPNNALPGDLTVGTLLPGYEEVQNQPKLTVGKAAGGNQHWSIMLDAEGVVGPNGSPIPANTLVKSTKNSKQLTGFFDTGFVWI
jgi:hypothetical protein